MRIERSIILIRCLTTCFSGKVTYHLKDGSTLTRTVEYFWDLETNSTPSKRKDQKSLLENQEEYIKNQI